MKPVTYKDIKNDSLLFRKDNLEYVKITQNGKKYELNIGECLIVYKDKNIITLLFSFRPNSLNGNYCLLEYNIPKNKKKQILIEGTPKNILLSSFEGFSIYNVTSEQITDQKIDIVYSSIMYTGKYSHLKNQFGSIEIDLNKVK